MLPNGEIQTSVDLLVWSRDYIESKLFFFFNVPSLLTWHIAVYIVFRKEFCIEPKLFKLLNIFPFYALSINSQ